MTHSRIETFSSALDRLADALAQPINEWTRDASIQRFEFTFELAWKCIQAFARREGIDCPSPRRAMKAAFRLGWIEDDEIWLRMLDDRNLLSHTYREELADQVRSRLPGYLSVLRGLLKRLEEQEDIFADHGGD